MIGPVITWESLGPSEQHRVLQRPRPDRSDLPAAVAAIIDQVRRGGDEAVMALTERFDGARPRPIAVDLPKLAEAAIRCPEPLTRAMRNAEQGIRAFHAADMPKAVSLETAPGMRCEVRYQPIQPVGLYIPGGSAALVSTVLMLGVPANLAGCGRTVLCTPPRRDGTIAPELLAAANLCGIDQVYAVGGAQAIAAMAYGTESIPSCAKLFGPGNAWVTEAKQQVSLDPHGAAIDLPAGPSEVLVIADSSADPVAVAWDLLSQAEHGPDSQAILLTDDLVLAKSVAISLEQGSAALPRASVLESSLSAARIVVTADLDTAFEISNRYAPEHLIINCSGARDLVDRARNAGSIFIGPWTPESLGDYCSGTNHVLPTYGWARSHSALSVADFMRRYTVQEASFEALKSLAPTAEALAEFEGLEAHRMAVRYRLEVAGG